MRNIIGCLISVTLIFWSGEAIFRTGIIGWLIIISLCLFIPLTAGLNFDKFLFIWIITFNTCVSISIFRENLKPFLQGRDPQFWARFQESEISVYIACWLAGIIFSAVCCAVVWTFRPGIGGGKNIR
jgi:hypothetical protein